MPKLILRDPFDEIYGVTNKNVYFGGGVVDILNEHGRVMFNLSIAPDGTLTVRGVDMFKADTGEIMNSELVVLPRFSNEVAISHVPYKKG